MLVGNPPYSIWSIWRCLSTSERLFLLVMYGVGIYSLFSVVATATRLLSLRKGSSTTDKTAIQRSVELLRRRCVRLRQLITAVFYLFGVVLFEALEWAYVTIDDSRTPGGWVVLTNFEICFAFAANVFLTLLVLHAIQWFVSSQVEAFASR